MNTNPNHTYFDGFYQEIWQALIPEALTKKEITHLLETYALGSATKVVDLMCGYGRHSLALARAGIPVTAIDNLPAYIQSIEKIRQQEALPLQPICQNLLEWTPTEQYDWALCMGNSLNFFSPMELPVLFQKIADSLVDGGYFWINSWSLSEIALKNTMDGETQSTPIGSFRHTNTFHLRTDPLRIEIQSRIEDENGNTEEKLAIDFLYSLAELQILLEAAGLQLLKTESIPGKKLFVSGDPRAYILIQKSRKQ